MLISLAMTYAVVLAARSLQCAITNLLRGIRFAINSGPFLFLLIHRRCNCESRRPRRTRMLRRPNAHKSAQHRTAARSSRPDLRSQIRARSPEVKLREVPERHTLGRDHRQRPYRASGITHTTQGWAYWLRYPGPNCLRGSVRFIEAGVVAGGRRTVVPRPGIRSLFVIASLETDLA